ncbi:hypothetical protein V6N13_001325 [Hibiscus sabdariffa]|uniref:Uncharacterized protein n=1 Tax=Hibiscus sabdariffa TaxID=183260 RepID=A0ABR2G9G4_9ROSI
MHDGQESTIMDAEEFAFDFEHDVTIDVGDSKASLGYGHDLSDDGWIYWLRITVLRPNHRDGLGTSLGGGISP